MMELVTDKLRVQRNIKLTLLLGGALVSLLVVLLSRLLIFGLNLGDAGLLDIIELVLRVILLSSHHVQKLILIGGEVVVVLILVVLIIVLVVVVVLIGRGDVVSGEVDVVVSDDLEEGLLVLSDGDLKGLLVGLFGSSQFLLTPAAL
jgi:hypothetical protein